MTFLATFANSKVKIPFPGPISTTVSDLSISAERTIFLIIFLSVKKFCPNECNGIKVWFIQYLSFLLE